MRCPFCRRNGTFTAVPNFNDLAFASDPSNGGSPGNALAGIRICPNPSCREVVFVSLFNGILVKSYPAERLDFDPSSIPEPILRTFEEAITDHANECYRSAAIMIRRTLEEICADQGAVGADLKVRLANLQEKIIVPKDLIEAAHDLRLLGNDAAHLEAQVYDNVGKEEVELAIDLAKELLKSVYQYSSIMMRLRALKKAI
jgi:Domain of unknown function (DUF4145)